MRGHIWTALLNPIDRPPTASIFFRTSFLRPSFHPKPFHYLSHSPLILISMLLLISGDIHPNPGPIDPCSVCSRRVTWGNRSNDLADSLAKAGASLDPSSILVSLTPLICSQRLSLYTSWRRSVQSGFFQHQIPSVSPEELTLPRSARCAHSRLRCNEHSTLLNSYLYRVGRAETPSCSNCGSKPQDLSHLVLDCPVLNPLRRAILGHTLSLLDLWSRPWGVARLLIFRGVDPRPHPPEWVG